MKYLVTILFSLTLFACNPAKRVGQQQKQFQQMVDEYNKDHPVRIDTVTKYITGFDSSLFFKKYLDSLSSLETTNINTVLIKYKDTCTTAIDTYNDGFNFGYNVGFYNGKLNSPVRVDTVLSSYYPTGQIDLLKKSADSWEKKYLELATKWQEEKSKKQNFKWLFFAACAVIILFTTLTIYKKLKP